VPAAVRSLLTFLRAASRNWEAKQMIMVQRPECANIFNERRVHYLLGGEMDELALDHCFWDAISSSQPFFRWLVSKTKFSERTLRLVTDEKWHQRWYEEPETKQQSETDILLILQDDVTGERFALYIENKPPHGKWRPNQPENYRKRAIDRMRSLRYVDFQTILLAPTVFIARHPMEAAHFDMVLTYEEVAAYVPEFRIEPVYGM
jgi:hypothetical protein